MKNTPKTTEIDLINRLPDFTLEQELHNKGCLLVAGADEVGRGSLAGPVVAATVVFDQKTIFTFKGATFKGLYDVVIDDSKRISAKKRERADEWIRQNALVWGLGLVSATKIDRLGIVKSTQMAFRKSLLEVRRKLGVNLSHLLVDAFPVPYVSGLPKHAQTAIIKGDRISASIASASIMAKVYRDNIMKNLQNFKNPKFKLYGWERNKGYGTAEHRKVILKHGITRQHRKSFVEAFLT